MRLPVWIASLWPGVAQAWFLGSGRGLGMAIAFAAVLNAALVATFVWPGWPIESLPAGATAALAWSLVLGLLVVGLRSVRRDWSRLVPPTQRHDSQIDEWFCEAQHEYLKGHWVAAESILSRLLARRPEDAEARLLLAGAQRRLRQWSEAKRTLAEMSQSPSAGRWQQEIEVELQRIAELESESVENDISPTESAFRSAA